MRGLRPIAIIGTATGRIGDPSGKNQERPQLDDGTLRANVSGITKSVEALLGSKAELQYYADRLERAGELEVDTNAGRVEGQARSHQPTLVLENGSFYDGLSALDFLGTVGRNFRMSSMLARDSVKSRLSSEAGLSFTEFSYQMLQAWDFWTLYRMHGCAIQLGGSDQWGNIVAGIDLVRRMSGDEVFGITVPLLTNSAGQKLGKSEGNATAWLNPEDTPHYSFYQYLMRQSDDDAINLLPKLTLLPMVDIQEAVARHRQDPHLRVAQTLLAAEVTRLVRGQEGLKVAKNTSNLLHGKSNNPGDLLYSSPSVPVLKELQLGVIAGSIPGAVVESQELLSKHSLIDLAVLSGACTSKSEAKRLAKAGGLSLNGAKTDLKRALAPAGDEALQGGKVVIVGAGKSRRHVITVASL